MNPTPLLQEALRRFDDENSQDPNLVEADGTQVPRELLYARWLTDWVLRLCPEASEPLRLAARCQHLCRWQIPRSSYEMNRVGYLKWRGDLKQFHARKSAEILRDVGYPEEVIERVQQLNLKKNLGSDPECQILEDALCLVTLQYQLEELIRKTPEDKMVEILRKTWKKMSPTGRQFASELSLSETAKRLVGEAIRD